MVESEDWSYDAAPTFSDGDLSDTLSFSSELASGEEVPAWMLFDSETGLLTGIPELTDAGNYALTITATDLAGDSVSTALIVAVTLFDAGRLLVSTASNDDLIGDTGNDTVTYADATSAVTVSLATVAQQTTGGHGRDTLGAIDNLIGSDFNDRLTGDGGDNVLDGGRGVDKLKGGDGDDTYIVDNAADKITETRNGGSADTVQSWVTLTQKLSNYVENVELMGNDDLDAIGNTLDNDVIGNAGNNRLDGNKGQDFMAGGAGDDTYVVDNTGDVISENDDDEGIDTVESAVTYTLAGNVENLVLTGSSSRAGTGNALDNELTGNRGSNILTGLEGDDILVGNAGKDMLIGGLGIDELSGGAGADKFIFESLDDSGVDAGNRDIIVDFIARQKDKIDLFAIDAKAGTTANDAFSWIADAEFSNVEGQLRYFTEDGNAIVEGDVNGDGSADFQIELLGVDSLQASNFSL